MASRFIQAGADATAIAAILKANGALPADFAGIAFKRDDNTIGILDPDSDTIFYVPVPDATGLVTAAAATTQTLGTSGTAGAATQVVSKVIKKAIPDAAATSFATVTIPNGNHAAAIRLVLLASIAAVADQFESSRVALADIVIARTTGANAVATAVALTGAGIATVAGGETITLAYGVSAVAGAVGAVNTVDIQVTITRAGGTGTHQVVALVELINAEASGVTVAAA